MAEDDGRILSEDDLQAIENGIASARKAMAIVERAKQAGIDVTEQEQQIRANEGRLLRIKQAFFPGR
jgi:ribosomal protein L32E